MKRPKTTKTRTEMLDRSSNPRARAFPKITPKTPNQEIFVDCLKNDKLVIGAGSAGTGKAQPLDSLILTPVGWKEMGSLKVGDTVRSINGWTTVTGVFPQGIKKVIKFHLKDGGEAVSCVDHIWTVFDSKGKSTSVLRNSTTSEIMQKLDSGSTRNVSLPVLQEIEYEEADLVIPPYVLGVLIGDGSFTTSTPVVTSIDAQIFSEVLDEVGSDFSFTKTESISKSLSDAKSSYKVRNRITTELSTLNLHGLVSQNKFIPDKYKKSSVDQRYSLLQGLLDTDGTVDKRTGAVSFCTTSKKLAKDVREIVLSLGGKSSISESQKHFTYKGEKKQGLPAYIVSINVPDKSRLFRLERKKILVSATDLRQLRRVIKGYTIIGEVECQCISVSDHSHLYVTDDFILTHNTLLACNHAAEQLYHGNTKKIVLIRAYQPLAGRSIGFLPGTAEEKLLPFYQQMLNYLEDSLGKAQVEIYMKRGAIEICSLETIRGRSWDNSVIIVDESQNLYAEEVQALVTRLGEYSQMVLIGDDSGIQTDIRNKKDGLSYLLGIVDKYNVSGVGVTFFEYEDILRSDITKEFVIAFDSELQEEKKRGGK